MKRMKFLNGIGAMFAFAVVALATTLTSCEKEDFNVNVEPINAQATINATVLYVDANSTTNVTDVATITYSEGPTFTGNPGLSAKSVTVTAAYNGITGTTTVNVPQLLAGQFLTLSTTIVLQEAAPEPVNAKAEVKPTVLYIADGITTDVTADAVITFDPANDGVFEGNPDLVASTSTITATYEGETATIVVNVPSLSAGQVATMSPTIVLQKKDELINAKAEIKPVVLYMTNATVVDVTASAEIVYDPANIFEGAPDLANTTSIVTATYEGVSASVSVNVPALTAGQYVTLTPTILLIAKEEPGVNIYIQPELAKQQTTTEKTEDLTNVSDFWWYESVTYTEKTGSKIVSKNILTTDFEEISKIGGFINTLDETYSEKQVTDNEVPVYSHSMTTVKVSYTIAETVYTFYRITETVDTRAITAKEVIATVTTEEYSTLFDKNKTNQQIPGHGHAPAYHGHGFDHGHGHGTGNAGGGIVIPD